MDTFAIFKAAIVGVATGAVLIGIKLFMTRRNANSPAIMELSGAMKLLLVVLGFVALWVIYHFVL